MVLATQETFRAWLKYQLIRSFIHSMPASKALLLSTILLCFFVCSASIRSLESYRCRRSGLLSARPRSRAADDVSSLVRRAELENRAPQPAAAQGSDIVASPPAVVQASGPVRNGAQASPPWAPPLGLESSTRIGIGESVFPETFAPPKTGAETTRELRRHSELQHRRAR